MVLTPTLASDDPADLLLADTELIRQISLKRVTSGVAATYATDPTDDEVLFS